MIWYGWVLWHISLWRLYNSKSSLCIYIKYTIGFTWVLWHFNLRGYLMPDLLYTYRLNIYNYLIVCLTPNPNKY